MAECWSRVTAVVHVLIICITRNESIKYQKPAVQTSKSQHSDNSGVIVTMNYKSTSSPLTWDCGLSVLFFFFSSSFHDSLFPPKWTPNTSLAYSRGSSLNLAMFDSAGTPIFCSWLRVPGGIGVSKSARCVAWMFYCGGCFGWVLYRIVFSLWHPLKIVIKRILICAGANVQ